MSIRHDGYHLHWRSSISFTTIRSSPVQECIPSCIAIAIVVVIVVVVVVVVMDNANASSLPTMNR